MSNVADTMGAADVCIELLASDMVFRSDDEKALVNALHTRVRPIRRSEIGDR